MRFVYLCSLIYSFFFFFSIGIALQAAIKSSKPAELIGAINKEMILLFSKNMTSGDPSLLLQTVCAPRFSNLNFQVVISKDVQLHMCCS